MYSGVPECKTGHAKPLGDLLMLYNDHDKVDVAV